jgi:hypothetical protein
MLAFVIAVFAATPSAFAEYWSCKAGAVETPNVVYVSDAFGPIPVVSRMSPLLDMRAQFSVFLKQKYSVQGAAECASATDAATAEASKKSYAETMVTQHWKVVETGWKYSLPPQASAP